MTHSSTEPKVTLLVEVRDADGNLKHVETINNSSAPLTWSARFKTLLRGQ
jgi:hypothetical protein